jgi:hypothetical protein
VKVVAITAMPPQLSRRSAAASPNARDRMRAPIA